MSLRVHSQELSAQKVNEDGVYHVKVGIIPWGRRRPDILRSHARFLFLYLLFWFFLIIL
jgi:hypothetical protein